MNNERDEFIKDNLNLVHSCCHRFKNKGIDYDDLYSVGCIGLIKAYDKFDKSLFAKAVEMNIINEAQQEMLNGFFENPDETMRNFLINHPEFLENSLNSDEKTKKRAQLLIDSNLYDLN